MKTKDPLCAINEECIRTFFNKDTMDMIIKIFGSVAGVFIITVFSFGFQQIRSDAGIKERLLVVEHKQTVRDSIMLSKLDELLKRGN